MEQWSLFGLSEHLERLSKNGDPLETLEATVDFEYFRCWLVEGFGYGDGSKGGRPPFDPVTMFKALILQAQHNLSDARMEFMIRTGSPGCGSSASIWARQRPTRT
jgi:hypothetical protein